MVKAIFFDIGGVVDPEPKDLWKEIFSDIERKFSVPSGTMSKKYMGSIEKLQTGKLRLADIYREALSESNFETEVNIQALVETTIKSFIHHSGKEDPSVVALVKKLRSYYKVGCITNTEPEMADFNRNKRHLYDIFDKSFLSSETGIRKPNQEVFMFAAESLGVRPEESVYIDNKKEYVAAAEKAGMGGILFVNPPGDVDDLKDDLISLGVDIIS